MNSRARRNLIARQRGEHLHDHAQVLFGWHGRMECRFDDTGGRLIGGRAALVPASAGHLYEGLSDDSELLVIDLAFSDPTISALERACGLSLQETLFQRPEILTLDSDTLQLLDFAARQLKRETSPDDRLVNYQLISLLMTQLCQLYQSDARPAQEWTRLDIAHLNQLIDARLAEPPTNAELAAALYLSESHFYHLFQRQFGITPQQYLMNRRLQHARQLLTASRMSLSALAAEVGFADASSFSRAFKRRFNETPGAVRRQPNT